MNYPSLALFITLITACATAKPKAVSIPKIPIPATGYSTPTAYPGYQLVWSDEFDGPALDTTNWGYNLGDGCPDLCGWGNDELEFYTKENATVQDGHLIITAKQQAMGGKNYTSSRITTKGKRAFQYGRVDIRAASPKGRGLWPAIWMMGTNIDEKGWPACGEVDIMELTGDKPNRVVSVAHFGDSPRQHVARTREKFLPEGKDFGQEFHVFTIDWKKDRMEFLLDNALYHTVIRSSFGNTDYPFNAPFYFLANVAVGGRFPGATDATTVFPQHLIVDYIRVFQKP
jgi:beta-glucanase (GH16 family)